MVTDRQTHRPSTVTLAVHACRGLITHSHNSNPCKMCMSHNVQLLWHAICPGLPNYMYVCRDVHRRKDLANPLSLPPPPTHTPHSLPRLTLSLSILQLRSHLVSLNHSHTCIQDHLIGPQRTARIPHGHLARDEGISIFTTHRHRS